MFVYLNNRSMDLAATLKTVEILAQKVSKSVKCLPGTVPSVDDVCRTPAIVQLDKVATMRSTLSGIALLSFLHQCRRMCESRLLCVAICRCRTCGLVMWSKSVLVQYRFSMLKVRIDRTVLVD